MMSCGLPVRREFKPKHFTGLGNLEDEGLAFAVGGEQFCAALAEDVNATSIFAFHEDDGMFRVGADVLDLIESRLGTFRQVAEELGLTELTPGASLGDPQAVGSGRFPLGVEVRSSKACGGCGKQWTR